MASSLEPPHFPFVADDAYGPLGGRRRLSASAIPRSRMQTLNVTAMLSSQSMLSDGAAPCGNRFVVAPDSRRANLTDHAVAAGADCVVCAQLADTDGRYFGRLMRDARARTALAQTIAMSMGFCTDHAALIASPDSKAPRVLEATIREACRRLCSLLERTALQDELLQDILFNARGRCPACTYFHRSEGRAVARVLHGLEHDGKHALPPPLCFVHTRLLVQRTEPPLRGRLVRQLRNMARMAITALDAPPGICSDEGVTAVRGVLYPLAREGMRRTDTPCACPVCEATRAARGQWLMAAAENVRLEQPGWLTLPTCRNHLLFCIAQTDRGLQRAALQHYLQAALPGRPATAAVGPGEAPKRRRHSKVRWFDTVGRVGHSNGLPPGPEAPQREPCPGCHTEEIAARRAIAQLIRNMSRAKQEDAPLVTSGMCLKHFAEALIYASAPEIEHRLSTALRHTLRSDHGTTVERDGQ